MKVGVKSSTLIFFHLLQPELRKDLYVYIFFIHLHKFCFICCNKNRERMSLCLYIFYSPLAFTILGKKILIKNEKFLWFWPEIDLEMKVKTNFSPCLLKTFFNKKSFIGTTFTQLRFKNKINKTSLVVPWNLVKGKKKMNTFLNSFGLTSYTL
jgi:hypothetical protein